MRASMTRIIQHESTCCGVSHLRVYACKLRDSGLTPFRYVDFTQVSSGLILHSFSTGTLSQLTGCPIWVVIASNEARLSPQPGMTDKTNRPMRPRVKFLCGKGVKPTRLLNLANLLRLSPPTRLNLLRSFSPKHSLNSPPPTRPEHGLQSHSVERRAQATLCN